MRQGSAQTGKEAVVLIIARKLLRPRDNVHPYNMHRLPLEISAPLRLSCARENVNIRPLQFLRSRNSSVESHGSIESHSEIPIL